jgi:hypothetical protein
MATSGEGHVDEESQKKKVAEDQVREQVNEREHA